MFRQLMIPVLASGLFIPSLATADTITVCANGCEQFG
jgi:hypothetical protein